MEKLKFNGAELELKLGVKALRGIEREAGKPLTSFGTKTTVENAAGEKVETTILPLIEVLIILKHGLGDKHSDDDCEAIMDENPGVYWTVVTTFYEAQNKVYVIAAAGNVGEGNAESPQD